MPRLSKRPPRKVSSVKAKMRRDDVWVDVQIANLSTSGMMVRCQQPPAKGSPVHIQRRGMTITGEVMWSTRTRFGMRSDEPIDCEALQANLVEQPDRRSIDRGDDRRGAGLRFWQWQRRR